MKLRRLSLLFMLVGCLSASAMAQSSGKVVKIKPEQSVYKVKQGSPFQVAIIIDIDNGYHINSDRPAEDYLIPTALKLEQLSGVRTNRVRYPKAKAQKFSFSDKALSVYEGRAILRFTARALANATPGNHTLRGKVTVQACNDQACLRPQTIDVAIPVEIVN